MNLKYVLNINFMIKRHLNSYKNITGFLVLLIIIIAIPLTVIIAQRQQEVRQRAAESVTLQFSTNNIELKPGRQTTVGLLLNTDASTSIRGLELLVKINGSNLITVNKYLKSPILDRILPKNSFTYDSSKGEFHFDALNLTKDVSGVENVALFTITFTANQTIGSGSITILSGNIITSAGSSISPNSSTVLFKISTATITPTTGPSLTCKTDEVKTDFGCIPKDPIPFVSKFYKIGLGFIGGVALLFIIYGAYIILTSSGNVYRINDGKSYIYYAIIGLALAIFGFLFIEVIARDILHIPGFG